MSLLVSPVWFLAARLLHKLAQTQAGFWGIDLSSLMVRRGIAPALQGPGE